MNQILHHAETIHRVLYGAGIEHVLVGDENITATGHQRFGGDLDFVIPRSYQLLARDCLKQHGFQVTREGQDVFSFQGPVALDLIFVSQPLFQEFYTHKKPLLSSANVDHLGLEAAIALKIQSYTDYPDREQKELQEITELVKQNGDIDWALLKRFADLFKQWPRIESIRGLASKVFD